MFKYAQRYAPLLILAILLVPLRYYLSKNIAQSGADGKHPPSLQGNSVLPLDHSQALYGIAGSPDDAWAVGGSFSMQGRQGGFPLPVGGTIMHYTDSIWSEVQVNGTLDLPLLSISLDSPQDGWAVGWAGTFVHYDGRQWSTKSGPANFKQNLLSVVMLSAQDGWAVGYSGTILHYNGSQWVQATSPTTLDLRSLALTSPDEGWAVGDSGTILHFHQGSWNLVSPTPANSTLNCVTMLSANEGWIVGRQGTILHYRAGSWESVHPTSYYQNPGRYQTVDFSTVTMRSMRSGWIAGGQHLLSYSSEAWLESGAINNTSGIYAGEGQSNISISSLLLSTTGTGWAVGSITLTDGKTTSAANVILQYQAGKWNLALISGK